MKHFIIFIDIRKKEVAKTLEFKKKCDLLLCTQIVSMKIDSKWSNFLVFDKADEIVRETPPQRSMSYFKKSIFVS